MSTPTQKQLLEQAEAKIADLEPKANAAVDLQTKLDEANRKLSTAEGERDTEKTRADVAEGKISAAEQERDTEKTRADQAEGKLTTAKQEATDAKASEQTMREQLAARGIKPAVIKKDAKANQGNGTGADATAEELREQLSASTDPGEKFTLSQRIRQLEAPKR